MFYDVVARVYAVALANFAADLLAIATAKAEQANITTGVTVHKRKRAEHFAGNRADAKPGLGVYCGTAATQAKRQGVRESTVWCYLDYWARGGDPAKLMVQLELAAEAACMTIDRTWEAPDLVFGAGEIDGTVAVELLPLTQAQGQKHYEGRVVVRFPVNERDNV